ncbi:MAG: hypothetical protein KGI82_00365 [Betaproteobacteria bacterium]|nr:hypothetical protein [Betaproteobacteria bacterium]
MSRPTFEQVFSALFVQLQTASGITTFSRRLKQAKDVQPEESPAMYQVEGEFTAKYTTGIPIAWDMSAVLVVVVVQSDDTVPMSPPLNAAIDGITQALAPAPAFEQQTLGGLVYSAAIDGKVEIFEGAASNTAVAFIPVRILIQGF